MKSFFVITSLFRALERPGMYSIWTMGNSQTSNDNNEDYDSTWEGEEGSDPEETTEFSSPRSFNRRRNIYSAKDMQTFRHKLQKTLFTECTDDYMEDDKEPNLKFYRNSIPFEPRGVLIEQFHRESLGDYKTLEDVHSYIQWLFPIQEKGMNFESRELSLKEILEFRRDEEVKERLLKSYKLMLDFYGVKLVDERTGAVERAENWEKRFANLNRNTHNNLRITRILKCLGLLGFQHYQKPLVHFFLEETLVKETLRNVKQSVLDYFMFAVVDKSERRELVRFAFDHFKPKDTFVWCPRRILNKWLKELEREDGTVSHNLNADSTKEKASDSNSQNNQLEKEDEIKIDINEDTTNKKEVDSKGTNDENVSECQNNEKQPPVYTAGNVSTSEIKEGPKASSSVDSQKDGHMNSENQAALQEGDDKNSDNISSSDESHSENSKETSNQSSTIDNNTKDASPSSRNSGIKQQGNEVQLKSHYTENDSKEHDSEEMEKSGSDSPGDGVANSAHSGGEKSTDMNSQEYTGFPLETDVSSGSLEQTSDKNPASSENIDTPGSDRNINCESELIGKEDPQAKSGPTHQSPTTLKSPISQENMANPLYGSEDQNQGNVIFHQLEVTSEKNPNEKAKEKNEDQIHQSTEDITEDRSTGENAGSAVTSQNNECSDSREAKNSNCTECEECKTLKNDVSSSHVTPDEDKGAGESSNEESVEDEKQEIVCVRNGDA
ncbi:opioid growth factor receptor-like protein 1 [Clarias magur]|uniref:Opioid growth factor receptor-like protein 1 n=1 Tax=Clarias magur TaxID=1594786 RepID=A0A8J4X7J8_CLAMG|nr:opioid growth factor receptor-like protein 1 [Clarias magur]